MVVGQQDAGGTHNATHPSGIPQDKIDNIMSGIANTGDVKMNNHRKKLRQRFDIIKKLGQGTYGKVQLGINKETGQEVAIKTIKKCKIEAESDLVRIRREVQIMSSVQHPNIIHIYEVFENREKMVLVMEFAAGGELYDYLSERKVLNEEEARRIFRQVATAVYYCHKHKICHRDLKLENILLDENGNAKIADFGLSNVFDEHRMLATFCGSPLYASPEIVEGTPYHGPEVDCWSLGVLLYTLVYGSMPFDGSNFKRLVKQISQGDYYEPKKPSRASSLIREMLTVCPRKRASIEQICSHWWVNENDNVSCLELAEDLANQTPVRLDVLLSLTPVAVTADQLVVPSADGAGANGKGALPRSHSVGSIRDMGPNTEAERRILDMVAAGGEAALMPSPTRTITPAQSPIQTKRKLENTISTENATGVALNKKEKADSTHKLLNELSTIPTVLEEITPVTMDVEESPDISAAATLSKANSRNFSANDMKIVGDLCEKLMQDDAKAQKNDDRLVSKNNYGVQEQKDPKVDGTEACAEAAPEKTKGATKVIKKFVNKHKTADLVSVLEKIDAEQETDPKDTAPSLGKGKLKKLAETENAASPAISKPFVRKCSLQDETPLNKFSTDRRKSRILETAEKFQQMNANTSTGPADKPKKIVIPGVSVGNFKKEFERKSSISGPSGERHNAGEDNSAGIESTAEADTTKVLAGAGTDVCHGAEVEASDSKASVSSLTLEDARKSMENSIALLRQAQSEDVNNICSQTESISVTDRKPVDTDMEKTERELKLKNARAIIGNAIQPATTSPGTGGLKTTTASITLKSATLPRRKTTKNEIQLDIKPAIVEQPSMRFTTEMQHPVPDLRSAPPREVPLPYSPIKVVPSARSTSVEPKEHIIHIHKPPSTYMRTMSNTTARSDSLSRQSTNESESDTTTTNRSQATIQASSQPIKKSPREFIIPIAVEGGGFITPREGSIEPSESTTSSRSAFGRLRPTRRIGSLLSEAGTEDSSPFQKLRTSSTNRDGDDEARFTLHKLRSSRPVKKNSQDNDSQSSGEEDDDDGFEILTAENLFSTLLQRVRAVTNRINVNNDIASGFPSSSRILSNMRQAQSPFWNQDPFGSRLNNAANSLGVPWRHSISRDLGSDMESVFSRTGATLPRGKISEFATPESCLRTDEPLDLADLDLSRLRLSKSDLETLSNIAPGLPKSFQEQLLAKLPPTQARKLSRTLSVQTGQNPATLRVYKRSQSSSRPTTTVASTSQQSGSLQESDVPGKDHSPSARKENTGNHRGPTCPADIGDKVKCSSSHVHKTSSESSQQLLAATGCCEPLVMPGRPPSGHISSSMNTTDNSSAFGKRLSLRRVPRSVKPDAKDHLLVESQTENLDSNCDGALSGEVSQGPRSLKATHHMHQNRSLESFPDREDVGSAMRDIAATPQCPNLSRPSTGDDGNITMAKFELAEKILHELQVLSSLRTCEKQGECVPVTEKAADATTGLALGPVVKKVKKVKPSDKLNESSTDIDAKPVSTGAKKLRRISKKLDEPMGNGSADSSPHLPDETSAAEGLSAKKLSKLKRPKSYPAKTHANSGVSAEICCPATSIQSGGSQTGRGKVELTAVKQGPGPISDGVGLSGGRESRLLRPKSYPASKLVAPKDTKLPYRPKVGADVPNASAPSFGQTFDAHGSTTPSATPDTTIAKTSTKKILQKSKLSHNAPVSSFSSSSNTTTSVGDDSKEPSPVAAQPNEGEKALEKKAGRGLLYAIGQKFEKLRASATSGSCANIPATKKPIDGAAMPEKSQGMYSLVKKTKSLGSSVTKKHSPNKRDMSETQAESGAKPAKPDKRSRIDAMIRNLRERSLPRSQPGPPSESNYIKRAVSVEEMPGTFNRRSVNKVLGLFKRYDRETVDPSGVRSVRSATNIQKHEADSPSAAPIYQNTDEALPTQKSRPQIGCVPSGGRPDCERSVACALCSNSECSSKLLCSDCTQTGRAQLQEHRSSEPHVQLGSRDKRRGLMLEFLKTDTTKSGEKTVPVRVPKLESNSANDNEVYSNLPPYCRPVQHSSSINCSSLTADNIANNNVPMHSINDNSSSYPVHGSSYRKPAAYTCTQNNNPSSLENIDSFASDARSYQEDSASSSTFRSPTEEPELYFDNWSVCSEDNYRTHAATPSPTISRLSRASQVSSPTGRDDEAAEPNESVVDRIRRRSFYCRFNEKKPKRTSSIVGPAAVREYYREQQTAAKARSANKCSTSERPHSPDITQEFFRPLKLSPVGTELKPPVYKSVLGNDPDYSSPSGRTRKSLSDIRTAPLPSSTGERRYATFATVDNDRRNRRPAPESSKVTAPASYYSTYNPKRRFSYNINGTSAASNSLASGSHLEGYATLGRRPARAYDHRTLSLLETSSPSSYRHDQSASARSFSTSLSRSNSRYHTASTSRSPTNI